MANFLTKIFGSRNQRLLKQFGKQVKTANSLEAEYQALTDEQLRAKTDEFKQRHKEGESLDALIPEAFAVVREASVRTLGLRHYDVQFIGGMVLHHGKIAEMRTGEGKTLVATLPAYLNSLTGHGVHIVTVNEYLASRDAGWMGPVYEFLGLSVGVVKSGMDPESKRNAYACDVIYGTNNEFGFDYLRDNLAFRREDKAQDHLAFAIVDEVDSILIDEARTPLIISGPSEDSTELYTKMNLLVPKLEGRVQTPKEAKGPLPNEEVEEPEGDYLIDEKSKQVHLTEQGQINAEELLRRAGLLRDGDSLYSAANISLLHHMTAALRAHAIFKKDVEYIVKEGEIVIVDEFTGRTMPGRRWSDGLHQAIEAKERVRVREETQTFASITFQNYFRMYDKLSGMTGTADTEAYEFQQIYGLEVVVIPTHKDMVRKDNPDLVYLTGKDKYEHVIEDIVDCHKRGQPALVGTTSIETSEFLSKLLKKRDVPHQVLNAKQHEKEADIVAQAGRPGRITIATNMAGRGTDIVLGGNLDASLAKVPENDTAARDKIKTDWKDQHQKVLEAGGLHIIGTERHESRRIDNQLRGRSGRQGDPGSSRFYLSMEDTLMRIFGDPERIKGLMARVGMKEGEAIESALLSRQIERAQRKVEAHNFDMRKNLLEYDDVANEQRKVVYHRRDQLMGEDDITDWIDEIRSERVNATIDNYIEPESPEEQWDITSLSQTVESEFGSELPIQTWLDEDTALHEESLRDKVVDALATDYTEKVGSIGQDVMRQIEKAVTLQQLDSHWKEHLAAMDHLRQGIHLRGYAQKNPKQEYKREAFEMFMDMLNRSEHDAISILSKAQLKGEDDVKAVESQRRSTSGMQYRHAAAPQAAAPQGPESGQSGAHPGPAPAPAQPFVREERKVGRNEKCPCGSGKKYKHCHGKLS
ncbi:MAG: preprotein translocase subunit SecA [Pseudomonadota bacterium]